MSETFNKWKQTLQENKEMQISDIFDLKDEDISDELLLKIIQAVSHA